MDPAVALDGMGGDAAPAAPVAGAIEAAADGIRILLVGDRAALSEEMERQGHSGHPGIEIVHAADIVTSGEEGARAVRAKPESSVSLACRLVGDGRAGAAVSAGNTGAMLAAATLYMRRVPGVIRPAIAVVLPGAGGRPVLLLDAGGSAEARPEHLRQFALMGRIFSRDVLGIDDPSVGLLSIGEEDVKGSELVLNAHALMRSTPGFHGNVEGRDIPAAVVDVIVTDGFTGNVVLKTMEGVASFLLGEVRDAVRSTFLGRVGGVLVRPPLRRMRDRIDPEEYGGAVLLGVRGLAVIGHGNATGRGVAQAVRVAARGARNRLAEHFGEALAQEGAERSPAT
ncbi:MAG: phosphate acyltransferase PlsX [Thermoleophilia bacterium]